MADSVVIFDTTLRDGEQCPGASMNLEEKLKIARMLERLGVDVIEAGFPIASKGDFESVYKICDAVEDIRVAALARAHPNDINRAGEALSDAKKGRIHTFISTSPLHMKHKLKMTPDRVLELVGESVTHARKLIDDVEWSAEDGSRTELDFLCRCVEAAISAGATTINIPDTVGYGVPEEYAALIKSVIERVPNADKAVFSVHCHDDLGLAVANSLAGVAAGARQIECTINGIGERAGNAALEEVVMAMHTRQDMLPFSTNIVTQNITRASKMVSAITGFAVQPNKAVVGANAFAHESGIHQDGMLKHAGTYEIMTPESVGLKRSSLVMGKHSGRAAFKAKLSELGFDLDEKDLNEVFERFKDLADRKKEVFDDDLIALVEDGIAEGGARARFVSMMLSGGTDGAQKADVTLRIDGEEQTASGEGDGPIEAMVHAIGKLMPNESKLISYQVHAVTTGSDAQAEVSIRLEEGGRTVTGQGADMNTLTASARAYLHGLSKLQSASRKSVA